MSGSIYVLLFPDNDARLGSYFFLYGDVLLLNDHLSTPSTVTVRSSGNEPAGKHPQIGSEAVKMTSQLNNKLHVFVTV